MRKDKLLQIGCLIACCSTLRADDMAKDIAATEAALSAYKSDMASYRAQNYNGNEFARDNLGKSTRFGVESFMAESQGVRDFIFNRSTIDRKLFPYPMPWRGNASSLNAEQAKLNVQWAKQLAAEKKKKAFLAAKQLGSKGLGGVTKRFKSEKLRDKILGQLVERDRVQQKLMSFSGQSSAQQPRVSAQTQAEIEAERAYNRARNRR